MLSSLRGVICRARAVTDDAAQTRQFALPAPRILSCLDAIVWLPY